MTDIARLAPLQRAQRYRELAADARTHAAASLILSQGACLQLAGQWEQLAREAELEADAEISSLSDI